MEVLRRSYGGWKTPFKEEDHVFKMRVLKDESHPWFRGQEERDITIWEGLESYGFSDSKRKPFALEIHPLKLLITQLET